ncbi:MAG: hypothetical protein WC485_00105 [Opitutaceae bacterium]
MLGAKTITAESPASRNRVTIVEHVYHQRQGGEPVEFVTRCSRKLNSDEQPYIRELLITEKWMALDCGWVNNPGLLLIRNKEGDTPGKIPTPAEASELAQRIIQVAFDANDSDASWLIMPGESMRAVPRNASRLSIRSLHGNIRASLCLMPR